jgi:hypothetical protein
MSSIAAAEKVVLLFGAKEQDRVERNAGKLLPMKSQSIVSVILVLLERRIEPSMTTLFPSHSYGNAAGEGDEG